jgi:hypothetical protein
MMTDLEAAPLAEDIVKLLIDRIETPAQAIECCYLVIADIDHIMRPDHLRDFQTDEAVAERIRQQLLNVFRELRASPRPGKWMLN